MITYAKAKPVLMTLKIQLSVFECFLMKLVNKIFPGEVEVFKS